MAIPYEEHLNAQQKAAVFHESGPALVIAGAGTGKTRTLIYRVARLVETGIDPRRVLLLTFTRRAAHEMLLRTSRLLEDQRAQQVAGGTFHSFAHMTLRRYGKLAGLPPNFTVLDRSDSEDVLQHLRTEMGFAGKGKGLAPQQKRFPQKRALGEMIGKAKNTERTIEEVVAEDWPQFNEDLEKVVALAERYDAYKRQFHLFDYDDLLLWLERILSDNPLLRNRLSGQFSYILVDEYQDTNRLQARLLRSLAQHRNIMAVGDDAQAIYSFRGADFRNIMEFPKDFPETTIYRIEENYRSTQPVLSAANAVMGKALQRHEKELFSQKKSGEPPRLVGCAHELAQASFIADEILRFREEGIPLEEMAVLFRSSYHSFELEAELTRRNVPFVKYGGFKFAEAAHIKDALAHLRWLVNKKDLVAAQRCLLLLEGVGSVSARKIADSVAESDNLFSGLASAAVPERASRGLQKLKIALEAAAAEEKPTDQLRILVPYLEPLLRERFDDTPRRMRDLEHLINIAKRFRSSERFVSDFSIDPPADHTVTGVLGVENEEEPLVLSTIHSAKGLEWRSVFVISVLDGYLPQDYAFRSIDELEEERRLLYVAMTRAKEHLILTYPSLIIPGGPRQLYGESVFAKPSHFLDDIPEETLPHTVLADRTIFDGTSYLDGFL